MTIRGFVIACSVVTSKTRNENVSVLEEKKKTRRIIEIRQLQVISLQPLSAPAHFRKLQFVFSI